MSGVPEAHCVVWSINLMCRGTGTREAACLGICDWDGQNDKEVSRLVGVNKKKVSEIEWVEKIQSIMDTWSVWERCV